MAVISGGDQIQILSRYNRDPIGSVPAPHAQALAISRGWLVYLTVDGDRNALRARRLEHPADPGKVRGVASVSRPVQTRSPEPRWRPARLCGLEASRKLDQAAQPELGKGGTVLRSRSAELLNPSVNGKHLLYVRVDRARQSPQKTTPPKLRQRLMLKRLGGHGPGHRIYSHGPDRKLWSTALSGRRGFVTLLGHRGPKIVSAHR